MLFGGIIRKYKGELFLLALVCQPREKCPPISLAQVENWSRLTSKFLSNFGQGKFVNKFLVLVGRIIPDCCSYATVQKTVGYINWTNQMNKAQILNCSITCVGYIQWRRQQPLIRSIL